MRGPLDDAVEHQEEMTGVEEAPAARVQTSPRLPGGKPLLRLLEVLESAGYVDAAEASVDLAVAPEAQEEFAARASRFTAAPSGVSAGASAARRRRRPRPERAGDAGEGTQGAEADAGKPTTQEAAAEEVPAAVPEIAEAYMEAAEHLGPPTPTGPQWRSIGPWTVINGQTYGASRVNVSGRVSAIVVDPANPAHVLAGAANGGVWESRDRGASWAPRTDYAATLAIGALAFNPSNSSIVYCGTGEGNWWWWLGAGMLRSSDGGASWTTLCTAPFVGQGFHSIAVNPTNGQHLIVGTTGGLYVSTNGGTTWTRRRAQRTWSISMPRASAAETLAACSDGLWRSTDGGTTWNAIALGGSPGTFDRLAVAIAPSNAAIAYAWGARGASAFLWRRAGGAWNAVATPPGASTVQAWYDWFVAVAPDRDTQVYCGDIELHRGDLAGTTWTWRNLTNKGSTGDSIHPDQHCMAFEPNRPDTIYVGNDGGVYRSANRGTNWQHSNNGLVISEFQYIAQDYGASRWLLGGTQDNGTMRWTGPSTWEHIADGDGGDCGVNRTDPRTVFHTFQQGNPPLRPRRSGARGNVGSWTAIFPAQPAGEASLFYPPFECSTSGGDTIAVAGQRLYLSRNNGTTWVPLALPAGSVASALHIPNGNNVYVGATNGRIFRAQWTGSAWAAIAELTTPRTGAVVSDLHVDPANLQRIWATYRTIGGGRVFRSVDGGSTWTDRTAGLPNLPMNAVEVDPSNVNRIWVAADLGVYQSLNAGGSWTDFSASLPNAVVGDLIFHSHARVLRAGTRNRGAWEIPVDGWMTQPVCGVQWTGNLAANEERRWFTFNWPATWHMIWSVMPTTPRSGAPQLTWTVRVERASAEFVTYWITVRNLTAHPVSFQGRYCILSRY
jgi:photosystem II stability/assembly factor-like uncharacterized protein